MTNKAYAPSRELVAQATGDAVYKKWISGLKELKCISNPVYRKWWIEDLEELHVLANRLVNGGLLTGLPASQLQLIVSRPVDQWLPLAK